MTPTLRIIDAIARHFGLSRHQILAKDRHRSVALARHVAMYCARTFVKPEPSLHELEREFAKDHTGILAAIRKMAKRTGEPLIAEAIEAGRQALVPPMPSVVNVPADPLGIPDLLPAVGAAE